MNKPFKHFSVLISNVLNIDTVHIIKHLLWVLNNFLRVRKCLTPKCLKTASL